MGSWVGLDVHTRSVVAGVIDQGSGEVRSLRVPPGPAEMGRVIEDTCCQRLGRSRKQRPSYTERRQSRTDLPPGYDGVPVLKTGWATGPGRSAATVAARPGRTGARVA